ncbi:hypothetical protein GKIL_1731 [Gloeobacter kilaueensis JS1]|uniref:Uncharacterized protein n=1 Tax=Gloeobacter kilaueensis (strain ATCC BAA-2537 / CCAP 1431/1 / ULC 316 / JS1) TaxID=1183438 RepID=U5QG86_GLOK1|nr:hypothetical protein GKIL_1731 [Gloeobacter kilaueensis JS1]
MLTISPFKFTFSLVALLAIQIPSIAQIPAPIQRDWTLITPQTRAISFVSGHLIRVTRHDGIGRARLIKTTCPADVRLALQDASADFPAGLFITPCR